MTAGRVVSMRKRVARRSSNHMDHISYTPTDAAALTDQPEEYRELAAKSVRENGGSDVAELLAMLGLNEGQ